jgi:predicted PurR-regulated permease PerM
MTSRELGRRLDVAIQQELGTPSQAIQAIEAGFSLLFGVILVFLSLAYMLIDGPNFFRYVLRFVPTEHRAHAEYLTIQIHQVLGRYLRGQLLLIVLMSTVTFLILEYAFNLPYALWIGILTGILEIIPVVGPITAGAIAATIGFSQGGATQAAAIVIVYFVLRQLEDQLVMPIVVGRAVHIHPLVTIFAVLVGEKIAGVLGMILAVPIAATIKVVLDYAYPTSRSTPRIELPNEPTPAERVPEVATH